MHETLLIADSSPLIVLTKIGRIGLLPQLAERVVVPDAVWKEVVVNKPERFDSRELADAHWLNVLPVHGPDAEALRAELDPGEAEAIALADQYPGCVLLMDDRMGRREAARRGVRVIGTLGLLANARRRGLIPSLGTEIDRLLKAGHFLSSSLVDSALRSVGEAKSN